VSAFGVTRGIPDRTSIVIAVHNLVSGDDRESAAGLLKTRGAPASFFITTERCGCGLFNAQRIAEGGPSGRQRETRVRPFVRIHGVGVLSVYEPRRHARVRLADQSEIEESPGQPGKNVYKK
jgi:hypothetical protein